MKLFLSTLIAGLMVLCTAASASADTITTLYASNNSGSVGGAVYFDLTVGANDITITGLDTNTSDVGTAFANYGVYTLVGLPGIGNETSAAWVFQTFGSGVGAGLDNPTSITLNSSFTLSAGTLYGIALVADPLIQHNYTNGNGPNQSYANADLSLFLGSATNLPFDTSAGGPFNPRVWNGSIHYDVVPEPASMLLLGIAGVGLVMRRRR